MFNRIAVALLGVGMACVATALLPGTSGLLPWADAQAVLDRILPLLLFLATVVVLAELTAEAEVFDVVAARVAVLGRGDYRLLFVLCVAFASLTTVVLNLDTTAVLLTPVMLALARKVGIAPVPLAMTTVWLANTASLLLPVSNLTNLLAQNRIGLAPIDFAQRMWPAQLASVAVTMVCLWVFFWRRGRRGVDRYSPPGPVSVAHPVLFWVAALACLAFVVAILFDVELWVASGSAGVVVLIAFFVRQRSSLSPRLFPWSLLVFVTGLFLVIETVSRHGLSDVMLTLVGSSQSTAGLYRTAFSGAGLANLVNNLPAYLAGETVVPRANPDQLLALLIGVNIGPLVTPWASLATLIWFERCRAAGVEVPLRRFVLTGAVLAVGGIVAAVGVLAVT